MKKLLPIFFALLLLPVFAHASTLSLPGNNLGLVGYWSFNEGTSTIAHDFSGGGYNGTLSTTGSTLPAWTSGKLGAALSFDGSTGYVNLGNDSAIKIPLPITVSAWVKVPNLSAWYNVLSTDGGVGQYAGVNMIVNQGGTIDIEYGDNGNGISHRRSLDSTATITANQWYHIVGVIRGPTDMSIYINGIDAGGSYSGTGGAIAYTSNSAEINGGYWNNSFLLGSIDEVRIYNRGLSAAEVAALYQTGYAKINASQSPGTLASGLVGWWTMDGADTVWSSGTAGNEIDKSGNGNTGVLAGFVASTKQAIGKIGQALYFSSGSMRVASSSTINQNNQMTVGFWIKGAPSSSAYIQYLYDEGASSGWQIQQDNLGTDIYLRVDTSAASGQSFGHVTVLDGSWHYVVYTLNQGAYAYYKDGSLVGSGSYSQGLGFSGYNDLLVNPSTNLQSSLDDVRLYNRALSASEVAQLYALGAGTHVNTSSTNLQTNSSLTSGLVGLWSFDGPTISGSSISDLSGNGNTATSNGATPTIGKLGQGMSFDGLSNYIDTGITTETGLFSNATFTVSTWIKCHNGCNNGAFFAGKWGYSQGFWMAPDNMQLKAGNYERDSDGTINVYDDNWHLITWVVTTNTSSTGGNSMHLYQDGVLHDGGTLNSTIYTPATGHSFTIGGRLETGHQVYFDGSIDDFRVYNRALSASEIYQLYLMGK